MSVTPISYVQLSGVKLKAAYQAHRKAWEDCDRCSLCESRRTSKGSVVLARGRLPCDILFIGEAPGRSENAIGAPFIGPAGKLLDKLVNRATEVLPLFYQNWTYAITNVVACYPTDEDGKTRQPEETEAWKCSPRLIDFIELAKPKGVVLLGKVAAKLGSLSITNPMLEILELHHPAYLLRKGGNLADPDCRRFILKLAEFISQRKA